MLQRAAQSAFTGGFKSLTPLSSHGGIASTRMFTCTDGMLKARIACPVPGDEFVTADAIVNLMADGLG